MDEGLIKLKVPLDASLPLSAAKDGGAGRSFGNDRLDTKVLRVETFYKGDQFLFFW
jgi:hypothetical protein